MIRVAVIDDREDHRSIAHAWLDGSYLVRTFPSLRDALGTLREWTPAIVFLDIMMPGVDGIEGLAKIRGLGGPFETLPIVAFTAHAAAGDRSIYRRMGFDDLLVKPVVEPEDFTRMIQSLVR